MIFPTTFLEIAVYVGLWGRECLGLVAWRLQIQYWLP